MAVAMVREGHTDEGSIHFDCDVTMNSVLLINILRGWSCGSNLQKEGKPEYKYVFSQPSERGDPGECLFV